MRPGKRPAPSRWPVWFVILAVVLLQMPTVAASGGGAGRAVPLIPAEEARPAALSEWGAFTPSPPPGHHLVLLLLTGAVVLAAGLAGFALGRSRRRDPLPADTPSVEDMRKLRATVTVFASLLHDGSALLMRTNTGTIDAANRLAASSEELLRLVAQTEARLENATERSEILATRVARSAAQEIKSSVESLEEIAERLAAMAPRAAKESADLTIAKST